MKFFTSREEAGSRLGSLLRGEGVEADVVLGLPRGGVVVAAAVANELDLPLDVIIVRKIGHPRYREFALGAMAEPDIILLDNDSMRRNPVVRDELENVINEEQQRLRRYQTIFHPSGSFDLKGKSVVIVDDGLATGATAEAAVRAVKRQSARNVIVAVPVASLGARDRLSGVAHDFKAVLVDPDFHAVGQYYQSFEQTTDEEVVALLSNFSARRNIESIDGQPVSNRVSAKHESRSPIRL